MGKRPRSVSKRNEELLMKQNSILGKEYINDVWAHATPDAEVGGLVVRLPLEMQVYRSGSKTAAGSELQRILTSSSSSGEDDNDYDDNFNKYIKKDNNSSSVGSGADLSVSILAAKTVLWYRKARSFVRKSMEEIYASAENERIEVGSLEEDQIEFIKLMLGGQQHWQEVRTCHYNTWYIGSRRVCRDCTRIGYISRWDSCRRGWCVAWYVPTTRFSLFPWPE